MMSWWSDLRMETTSMTHLRRSQSESRRTGIKELISYRTKWVQSMWAAFACSDSVIMSVSDTVVIKSKLSFQGDDVSSHWRTRWSLQEGFSDYLFHFRDQYLFQVGIPFQVNAERPLEEVYADIKEILQGWKDILRRTWHLATSILLKHCTNLGSQQISCN